MKLEFMTIEKFEDIIAWQKSKTLTLEVYKSFKDNKDYSFKNQIQKASVSVMNNIAEGYERKSNKEFKQFLFIAKGSAGEVRTMLHLAKDIEYIDNVQYNNLLELSLCISRMLSNFIKKL
ncbi:MAG: four helix bundle protein [Ignavibacteria bacterium]